MDSTGRVTIEILDRIRSGAPSGLDDFVRLFGPKVLVFINFKLGEKLRGKVEAEDVLQDFFTSIVENREGFLEKVDSRGVHRTIYRLVENHIKDLYEKHFQTKKRDSRLEVREGRSGSDGFHLSQVAGSTGSFTHRIEAQDEYKSLQKLLDRILDEESRKLFVLKYVEECTNQEIADELGTSVSTVKRMTAELTARIQRARRG
ncbi:MAG: sigma-70 family RNA polymerase sigma factor [Planctomycetes bacterium]|nr:sigma-70 family RNA polymerase sigma factor [Planctomycetota bacterium]